MEQDYRITTEVKPPVFVTGLVNTEVKDRGSGASLVTKRCADCGAALVQLIVMPDTLVQLRDPFVFCCGKLRRIG